MQKDFQLFIDQNNICNKSDRILLGISGGIDSVCMLHLFKDLDYHIGIAHCNFQLRGEESDNDELFVRDLAEQFDIPFFSIRFNTSEIAASEGISIQMAARDLRYEWFEEIREKHEYDFIAIAHNKDDIIETFLINLTRGSGIKGFTGIKPKLGNTIRPLLFAHRSEIRNYIEINNLDYREDSSNSSTKYSRNLIRHEIVPLFEKLNPKFRETMIANISRLKDIENIYLKEINYQKNELINESDNHLTIDIEKLKQLNPINTYLHEILYPFGFSRTQVSDITDALDATPGKQFISLTHRLIKDRNSLIIEEISFINRNSFFIDFNTERIENPISLSFSKFEKPFDFGIIKDNDVGLFDLDKIEFPITLRRWQKGDYFMPLGMGNLKKLSDFFIDSKISILEKETTWILESNNKIIWIIGQRIDDRFKITEKTKNILQINSSL